MINKKIIVPRTSQGLLFLARDILKAHQAKGAESPLNADMVSKLEAIYNNAKTTSDRQAELTRKAHKATDARNRLIGIGNYSNNKDSVYRMILGFKKILEGSYLDDPRQLSDYGFEVDTYHNNGSSQNHQASEDVQIDDNIEQMNNQEGIE